MQNVLIHKCKYIIIFCICIIYDLYINFNEQRVEIVAGDVLFEGLRAEGGAFALFDLLFCI